MSKRGELLLLHPCLHFPPGEPALTRLCWRYIVPWWHWGEKTAPHHCQEHFWAQGCAAEHRGLTARRGSGPSSLHDDSLLLLSSACFSFGLIRCVSQSITAQTARHVQLAVPLQQSLVSFFIIVAHRRLLWTPFLEAQNQRIKLYKKYICRVWGPHASLWSNMH